MPAIKHWLLVSVFLLACPLSLQAGMTSLHLTELAQVRLQTISFFLGAFAISALFLKWAWNALAKDVSWMPRLKYRQAVAVLVVSGLFVHVALSLIAGARELMTPGAWMRTGTTHQLPPPERSPKTWLESARISALETLRDQLWQQALAQSGKLPNNREASKIDSQLWAGIHPEGSPLGYVPDQIIDQGQRIVVFEPDDYGAQRFVLQQDGKIIRLTVAELTKRLRQESLEKP